MKTTATRYSPELRERAVRMVLEHQGDHGSQWAAIASIAGKVGCTPESLRRWVRQAERDRGLRRGQTVIPPFLAVAKSGAKRQGPVSASA